MGARPKSTDSTISTAFGSRSSGRFLRVSRARDWTASLEGYAAFAITSTGATWHTPGFARYIV